jgi:hypothetical protein
VVTDLVRTRWRDKRNQPLNQFERLENHCGGAIAPGALESILHSAIRALNQEFVGEGRAGHVTAELL